MNKPMWMVAGAVLAATALLSGCFGGDSAPEEPPAPSNEVPASATASVQAYVGYAKSLAADDLAEPLLVDKVVPPTSETEEPVSLT